MPKKKISLKDSLIIVTIFLIIMTIWSVITGLSNLGGTKTTLENALSGNLTVKECVTGEVPRASQNFLSINHSLNFIPTGTEHFYLVLSEDYGQAVIIRANASWGKQFNDDGVSDKPVKISGKVKKLPKDVKQKFDTESDLVMFRSKTDLTGYVDTLSPTLARLHFVEAALCMILLVIGIVLMHKLKRDPQTSAAKPLIIGLVVCLIAALCLWIYLLNMK